MKNTIDGIINEEIQKLISEGYVFDDDSFNFSNVVTDNEFYNYSLISNDYDIDILESNILIQWSMSFWLNDNGIENIVPQIKNIEGMYTIQMRDKQTDESLQETQKNINEFPWKFAIGEFNLTKGGSLYVTKLIFDFKTKICQVLFNT